MSDAIFDSDKDMIPITPKSLAVDPSKFSTTHTLTSRDPGHYTIDSIHNSLISAMQVNFKALISTSIDIIFESDFSKKKLKDMPRLDKDEVKVYRTLTIKDFDTSGKEIEDKILAHDVYHGNRRKDYFAFNLTASDGSDRGYAQAHMFLKVSYKQQEYSLCLAQRFTPKSTTHITGLEVVEPASNSSYRGMFLLPVEKIDRSIHIVPDFATRNDSGSYSRYLVNCDTDLHAWIHGRGKLPKVKKIL